MQKKCKILLLAAPFLTSGACRRRIARGPHRVTQLFNDLIYDNKLITTLSAKCPVPNMCRAIRI